MKRAEGLGTETSTCMSEVLALAVEALVPLRHKAVNDCLVKFPGLRCEPVPHVLLGVVVRGESFAPQSLFQGTKTGVIAGREVWTVWRGTENLPLDFMLAISHVTCTRDPLAAGSELPRSCQNHSLLHTQRYCHRFAHSRLRLVSFLTLPACFFFMPLIFHRWSPEFTSTYVTPRGVRGGRIEVQDFFLGVLSFSLPQISFHPFQH